MMAGTNGRNVVYLLSSANGDILPDNSRDFFANKFNQTISNRQNRDYFVRLRSVAVTNDFRTKPGYVKVQLQEVEQQIAGLGYNRCLGGFKYPPADEYYSNGEKKVVQYMHKIFDRTPYLPLSFQVLDGLRVLFTDLDNHRIAIGYGPPTIVELEIVTAEEIMEQRNFTITCASFQPSTFRANTMAKFTCPLPEMLDLKNYEVAVLSVVYPPNMSEECTVHIVVEDELYLFRLIDFESTREWIRSMNQAMALGRYAKELAFISKEGRDPATNDRIQSVMIKRRRLQGEQKRELRIKFSWIFSQAIGEDKNYTKQLQLKPNESFFFNTRPDIHKVIPPPVALLQCDVVKPCLVGGAMKPIIATVPVLFKSNRGGPLLEQKQLYEPAHLHYTDVKETPFDTIAFQFLAPGAQIHDRRFMVENNFDANIVITLSFRPKRN